LDGEDVSLSPVAITDRIGQRAGAIKRVGHAREQADMSGR
jgi:hypothetical protein